MSRGRPRLIGLARAALVLALIGALGIPVGADEGRIVRERKSIPVDVVVPVPCLGEDVRATGVINVFHQVIFYRRQGTAHVIARGTVDGATAVGQTTGRTFQGSGAGHKNFSVRISDLPRMFNLYADALFVSSDGSITLKVRVTMQEIVYPDGNIDGTPVAVDVMCE